MKKDVYSFSATPGMIPKECLQQAQDELLDWHQSGIGVMEMNHRTQEFMSINVKAMDDLRAFLNIPKNYQILFMQGGATLQYAAVPMNLLQNNPSANYIVSGYASQLAYEESKKYCNPILVNPMIKGFTELPNQFEQLTQGAYSYYVDNETVNGLQFNEIPLEHPNLVCDMTSSLGTKSIDVSKYGLIFSTFQSNLGVAGLTAVIIRDDLIGRHHPNTPSMFNYKTTYDYKSIFNTTPVFAVYSTGLYLNYLNNKGGIKYYEDQSIKRSKILYEIIDSSHRIYQGYVTNKDHRSKVSHTFSIENKKIEKEFIQQAEEEGLRELQGHFSIGGLRVCLCNGLPEQGFSKLLDFMQDFVIKHQS